MKLSSPKPNDPPPSASCFSLEPPKAPASGPGSTPPPFRPASRRSSLRNSKPMSCVSATPWPPPPLSPTRSLPASHPRRKPHDRKYVSEHVHRTWVPHPNDVFVFVVRVGKHEPQPASVIGSCSQ